MYMHNNFSRYLPLLILFGLWVATPRLATAQSGSTICQFQAGPRAGQTQDYAPMSPLPVGTSCQDGQGSTGVVVAAKGGGITGGGGGIGPMPGGQQMGTVCRFQSGSRAGQTQDYSPQTLPVGSRCWDGQDSYGVVVASMGKSQGPDKQLSTRCQFNTGPRAGQIQDYAPMPPLSIGTPCQDGQGSTGVVVQ